MSDPTSAMEVRCRHCASVVPAGVQFCSHCGASVEPATHPGDPLLARLRDLFGRELEFEGELGRGGMAVVYSAFDPALERRVAVKTVLPEVASHPEMVERFLREARTVAALQHPHVVSVYSVRAGDGVSAIVMQFVEGRSLDVILRERSPLPLPVAGLLLTQIAAGLQHAHDRGVIHRDVKPANVLIDREGNAVVSDFGIARRDGNARLTNTGVVVGTMAYMSPEQRSGRPTGPASDQYAFGVMAFKLLAGRLPFTGSLTEMHKAHLSLAPPSLRQFRPEVSPAVEALVHRMLRKDPEARHPNLREIEREFRALIPDGRATTMIVAGYATAPAAEGSRVQRAVTVAAVKPPPKPAAGAVEGAPAAVPPEPVLPPPAGDLLLSEGSSPRAASVRARGAAAAALLLLVGGAVVWRALGAPKSGTSPSPETAARAPSAAQAVRAPTPAAGGAARAAGGRAETPARPGAARAANPAPSGAAGGAIVAKGTGTGNALSSYPTGDSAAAREAARQSPGAGGEAAPAPGTSGRPAASASAAAATADARAVAREFVTMLNQRRWHELELLASLPGDAALRTELVRLTRSAQDFSAGFDRVASPPEAGADGFVTECVIDLQWHGGHRLVLVRLRGAASSGGWHLAAFGAESAD